MWELAINNPIQASATLITLLPIITFTYRLAYYGRAMRFFFIYLVAKLLIELVMWYMASRGVYNLFLGNILTIIGFVLIARMFYEAYESKLKKMFVYVYSALFLLVVSFDLYRDGIEYTFKYSGMAQSVFTMALCLMYFYELIQHPKIPDLLSYPFFWLCSALLLYFAPCVFISPMQFYLDRFPINHTMHIFSVLPYLLETAYLFIAGVGILTQK